MTRIVFPASLLIALLTALVVAGCRTEPKVSSTPVSTQAPDPVTTPESVEATRPPLAAAGATKPQPEKTPANAPAVEPEGSKQTQEVVAIPGATEPTPIPTPEPPVASAPTGTEVGNRVPDFTLSLLDGSSLTSAALQSGGRPVFLFFSATW